LGGSPVRDPGVEISISIQKEDKMKWWKCVLVGDAEINTQKVQPENSKLSDLDGDTRQTVSLAVTSGLRNMLPCAREL